MPPLSNNTRYRLQRPLGQGGFSTVWLARDLREGASVAIKVFSRREDGKGIRLCREEYRKTAALRHPNIIEVLDAGEEDGEAYLVMPYYPRGSVQERVGQVGEAECWQLIHDIGSALAFLHGSEPPVLHNDLKPDNFLETSEGRYILADFGISLELHPRFLQSNAGMAILENSDGLGPMAYRAPELFGYEGQERGIPVKVSEIWSLGACLYEIATGEAPYGEQGGLFQVMERGQGARVRNLGQAFPSGFSQELRSLILSCLFWDRYERPTAEELVDAARPHLPKKTTPKDLRLIPIMSLFMALLFGWAVRQMFFGVRVVPNGAKPESYIADTLKKQISLPLTVPVKKAEGNIVTSQPGQKATQPTSTKEPLQAVDKEVAQIIQEVEKLLETWSNRQITGGENRDYQNCKNTLDQLLSDLGRCDRKTRALECLCRADPNCSHLALLKKKYGCANVGMSGISFGGGTSPTPTNSNTKPKYYAGVQIGIKATRDAAIAQIKLEKKQEGIQPVIVMVPGSPNEYAIVLPTGGLEEAKDLLRKLRNTRACQLIRYKRVRIHYVAVKD